MLPLVGIYKFNQMVGNFSQFESMEEHDEIMFLYLNRQIRWNVIREFAVPYFSLQFMSEEISLTVISLMTVL